MKRESAKAIVSLATGGGLHPSDMDAILDCFDRSGGDRGRFLGLIDGRIQKAAGTVAVVELARSLECSEPKSESEIDAP